MRDGTVGQHAFYVGLNDRAEIAGKHGERRENPEGPEPVTGSGIDGRENAQQQGEGGGFGAGGKERGDGRGRAFVDVGRPNLERRSGDFEAEADENQGQAKTQQHAGRIGGGQVLQVGAATDAVDERNAVEEEGRGEGAEQKIFYGGFGGLDGVATVASEDVAGDGRHFEADEGGKQFLSGSENAHPSGGKQDESIKFGGVEILAFKIGIGGEDDQECYQADEPVKEQAIDIALDQAAETRAGNTEEGEQRAERGADHGDEGDGLAKLHEGLKQHEDHAKAAPS